MNTQNINSELYENLEKLAYQESKPFCYNCYKVVEKTTCKQCHSDDNMRITQNNGPEYGVDWIIEDLIEEHCEVYRSEDIEGSLADCYEESIQVGWINVNPIEAIKVLDPTSFSIAKQEYLNSLVEDEQLIESRNSYYWIHEIEAMLDEKLNISVGA